MSARPVAIVGSGAIGVAFAVLFARAGRATAVFDIDEAALERGRADVRARLRLLADAGLLDEEPPVVAARIGWHTDAAAAARDAELVQECAPERADLKREAELKKQNQRAMNAANQAIAAGRQLALVGPGGVLITDPATDSSTDRAAAASPPKITDDNESGRSSTARSTSVKITARTSATTTARAG